MQKHRQKWFDHYHEHKNNETQNKPTMCIFKNMINENIDKLEHNNLNTTIEATAAAATESERAV